MLKILQYKYDQILKIVKIYKANIFYSTVSRGFSVSQTLEMKQLKVLMSNS